MSYYEEAFTKADFVLEMDGEPWMPFRLIPACPEGVWMGKRGDLVNAYEIRSEPRHRVVLSEPFLMASIPVTREQYWGWALSGRHPDISDVPLNASIEVEAGGVERMREAALLGSLADPDNFIEWLASWAVFPQGFEVVDLPTEAQWEYACRAGTDTEFWNGDGLAALEDVGWFKVNSKSEPPKVAEKPSNDFGLFDMHGNVWECCRDGFRWNAYFDRVGLDKDPKERPKGPYPWLERVLRGGSWKSPAEFCSSFIRNNIGEGCFEFAPRGFRLCLYPRLSSKSGPVGGLASDSETFVVNLSGVRSPEIGGSGK